MDGKVPVITATVSFGMGVDKASVRYRYLLGFYRSGSARLMILEASTGYKRDSSLIRSESIRS
jgi:hypothetical protein